MPLEAVSKPQTTAIESRFVFQQKQVTRTWQKSKNQATETTKTILYTPEQFQPLDTALQMKVPNIIWSLSQ
jgi:hypothetical protein